MIGPVPAALNIRESTAKSPGGISFAIGKHALRRYFTRDHRMHVICPDVDGMRDPLAMPAHGPNGF
jgi:hypothetical protein